MSRPKKIGLDYFPMDVDLNDQVQALELIHGNDGFVWLIKFWQLAYKNEFGEVILSGLFGDISAKNSRITPEKQRDIINVCQQLGLIHEVREGVYSSNGVQKRIAEVSSERRNALLRHKKELFGEKLGDNSEKTGESKVKERKVKESKDIFPEIVFSWNQFAQENNLSQVKKIDKRRERGISERQKDKDFNFDLILTEIKQSDFLLGKSADWKVDFDFIFLSPHNFIKILEGKYRNNGKSIKRNTNTNSQVARAEFEHTEKDVQRFRDLEASLVESDRRRAERAGHNSI